MSVRFELCEVEVQLRVDRWMGGGGPLSSQDGGFQSGPASIVETGKAR